ncbi:hypothetical protein TAMA11512_16960 [Selenomonas sp. TAMA-11512]|uniref:hypothetical protein n=1 Tax=Selenomonas sp. TAMA-11512 TaxID=3095337 RepID=UPI0030901FA2|nr:hypothetical protein TAMA11512_16960 [Selenomonas sp. TAMA-11512]
MNISNLYSVNDCLRNADIRTYNCGYLPIAISRPGETIKIYGLTHDDFPFDASILNRVISLKLYYAMQVMVMSLGVLKRKYSSAFDLKWVPINDSFNKLVYKNGNSDDAIAALYEIMKSIAESGIIKVSEGYTVSTEYQIKELIFIEDLSFGMTPDPVVNIIIDTDDVEKVYKAHNLLNQSRCKLKDISYGWDDIKDYFTILSLKDMELLHGKKINRFTEKDVPLFDACANLDINVIRNAIQEGASVLAINQNGETPLCKCVEAVKYHCLDEIDSEKSMDMWKKKISRMKECVDYLLQHGADINLYGFGCLCTPLCESAYIPDARVMEFLLSRGADPNFNTNFDDMCCTRYEWYIRSSVLSRVYDDLAVEGEKYKEEQKDLLLAHGAKLFLEGYNPKTGKIEETGENGNS